MYRKILVPLDGSHLAEQILPHVMTLAQCTGAQVVLLQVATTPVYAFAGAEPRVVDWSYEGAQAEASRYLRQLQTDLRASGVLVSCEVATGSVAGTITEFAQNLPADLIAMSTHGRRGVARTILGSVADEVVRHSPIPVLLVHPH